MSDIALATIWWAAIGFAIGINRHRVWPGPNDGLRWAVAWAIVWPILWLVESADGK